MTLPDVVAGAVGGLARTWSSEAKERRRISASDPVADTLEYCAGELAARLQTIADEEQRETVEQRARRERVSPQTIRAWIRTNQLPAIHGAKGYEIPRSAKRVRRTS